MSVAVRPSDMADFFRSAAGMSTVHILSRAIHATATLGIADRLRERAKTSEELAEELGVHAPSLHRLLVALSTFGIFAEAEGQRFALNMAAQPLRSDSPRSQRNFVLYNGSDWQMNAWTDFLETIRTGQPHFERASGISLFNHLSDRPEAAQLFDNSMGSITAAVAASLAGACELQDARCIVDIGGGIGTLLAAALEASPHAVGVLVEQPACIEVAKKLFSERALTERCTFDMRDFFSDALPGGDVYLLKHVLHDWDDARALRVLENCRRAMEREARLLVIEAINEPDRLRPSDAVSDLAMLHLTGGRERTEAEYRELIERSGCRFRRRIASRTPYGILEATAA